MIQYQFKNQLGEIITELRNQIQARRPQLWVIRLNSPVYRIKLIGKLNQLAESKGIRARETYFSPNLRLLDQIETEYDRSAGAIDTLLINGFGSALKDIGNEDQIAALLEEFGRDLRKLPVPVVLWLPTFILDIAYRRCPNFWHYVSEKIIDFKQAGLYPKEAEYGIKYFDSPEVRKKRLSIIEKQLEELRQKPDALPSELVPLLLMLGTNYFEDEQYEKAFEAFTEMLTHITESTNPVSYADVMYRIGMIYHVWGYYEKAKEHYRTSERIRLELGDTEGLASAMHQLGLLYQDMGEFDKAIEYYTKSTTHNKTVGLTKYIANTLINIGTIYEEIGVYKDAVAKYREAFDLSRQIQDQRLMALSLAYTGRIYEENDKKRESVKYLVAAHSLFERMELPYKAFIAEHLKKIEEFIGTEDYQKLVEESKNLARNKGPAGAV
ncbi:MAG: tetratricopeptide repeat protein [Chlorobiales bacterium]|nr:tetratricopeptide repeat protein [Chlorobiales bacterium]